MTAKNVLLVGAGQIAHSHAAAIARRDDIRIGCVVDPAAAQAREFAAKWQIGDTATDLGSAIGSGEFDGVVVCSPTAVHCEQALTAIEAGLPVLVEKPFAADLAQAERIIAASAANGVPVVPAQIVRHLPMVDWAKRLIAAGDLGEPIQAIERRLVDRADNYPWWKDLPNFLVSHWGSHSVDMICYLLQGQPAVCYCRGRSVRSIFGVVDDFSLQIEFADGFRFSSSMSFSSRHIVHDLVLIGTESTVVFDCYRRVVHNGQEVLALPEQEMLDAGFDAEIDAFGRAIDGADLPEAATYPVTVAMAALDAAEKSVTSGRAEAVAFPPRVVQGAL